jgi:hypothetical protein
MQPPLVAGKPVTVTIPQAMLKLPAGSAPIMLHIGGWTDEIYQERTEFQRLPEIARLYTVNSTRTVIASAFGGLIYITLPEGMKLADQTITVTGRFIERKLYPSPLIMIVYSDHGSS